MLDPLNSTLQNKVAGYPHVRAVSASSWNHATLHVAPLDCDTATCQAASLRLTGMNQIGVVRSGHPRTFHESRIDSSLDKVRVTENLLMK